MALNKTQLKTGIKGLLDELVEQTENPDQAREKFASDLADLIDVYVKTGTVNTTVTVTTPSGPGTGTGTGTIS